MADYTFPRTTFDIQDLSVSEVTPVSDLSLHRPIFVGFAQQGPVGVPFYGDITELRERYGVATFNIGSDYFTHNNLFATACLQKNKILFVRVADENAAIGDMAIVCETYVDDGKVYLRHVKMSVAEIRTATGIDNLKYSSLKAVRWSVTQTIGGIPVTGTARALLGGQFGYNGVGYPGVIANQSGIDLFYDDTFSASRQEDMESIVYKIGYVQKPLGEDYTSPINNTFGSRYTSFSPKKGVIDPLTESEYFFDSMMKNSFQDTMKPPFPTVLYGDNWAEIGQIILDNEPTLDQDKPYMVNILTAQDFDNLPYTNTSILDSDTSLEEGAHHYFLGGSDGDLSNDTYESLVKQWYAGTTYPDIVDAPRYPITHVYDSGYSMQTKYALIDFMTLRKQVKIVIGTHVHGYDAISKEDDLSMTASLRARMIATPESTIYGTEACRGEIIQASGIIIGSKWDDRVPMTYEIMMKRAEMHNATFIKGEYKGFPSSTVSYLRDLSWTATTEDHKQLSWEYAGNYFQYYDKDNIHYPDIRSIYTTSRSLLSDAALVDYLCYSMYFCHEVWAEFSGKALPAAELQSKVKKRLDDKFSKAFGSYVNMTSSPKKTTQDIENGDSITVDITVTGNDPFRVMYVHSYVVRNTTA